MLTSKNLDRGFKNIAIIIIATFSVFFHVRCNDVQSDFTELQAVTERESNRQTKNHAPVISFC